MTKRTQKTLYLDSELYKEFKKFCIDLNISMSQVMELLMSETVNNKEFFKKNIVTYDVGLKHGIAKLYDKRTKK